MRGGDAKPRRAARKGTAAQHPEARGLSPRAFPAKRRTSPGAKAQLSLRLLEAPLGDVADADDADGALAGDDRNVTKAALDHRLTGFLD